jgi:hypothetical protein
VTETELETYSYFIGGWNAALVKVASLVKEKTGDRDLVEAIYELAKDA